MNLSDVIIVGTALAMDALGVTLSIGLNSKVSRKNKIAFIISFAFFQFLLFFIGGAIGNLFEAHIVAIPHLLGGIIIGTVGLMMIKEGFKEEEKDDGVLRKPLMIIILGISVNIDALVVGFTAFHNLSISSVMILDSIVVGMITLLICTTGFYMCKFIRKLKFIVLYADFLGGIILILFAIKMICF